MKLLLDTHSVAWAILQVDKLSQPARQTIEEPSNQVHVSICSAWEIAIKVGLGKWPEAKVLLHTFEVQIEDAGFVLLPIKVAHVRVAGLMQGSHRDPFDRLLVAQASVEDLTLVTSDAKVRSMGVPCLW